MACTVIPTKIPTIDKTAIPTNKYQRHQPRGGGMIPIPEKWLVYDWYNSTNLGALNTMVTSELTGEVSMGVLLVFLVFWKWGRYIVPTSLTPL